MTMLTGYEAGLHSQAEPLDGVEGYLSVAKRRSFRRAAADLGCARASAALLKGFSLGAMALWVFRSIVDQTLFLCQKPTSWA